METLSRRSTSLMLLMITAVTTVGLDFARATTPSGGATTPPANVNQPRPAPGSGRVNPRPMMPHALTSDAARRPESPLNVPRSVTQRVVNPTDNMSYNVTFSPATRGQLARIRPSALYAQREQIMQGMLTQCANRRGTFAQVRHDFVPESLGFHTAVAISANMEAHGDPAALMHWWEQSITDPMSHVSFAMFMLTNRAAGSFFNMIGWGNDPCRTLSRFSREGRLRRMGRAVALPGPTVPQRIFGPVVGGLSMSAGMIVSGDVHELLMDPNIRLCGQSLVGMAPDVAAAERACDRAYEEWTLSHRLMVHVPDIISNVLISVLQGHVINPIIGGIARGGGRLSRGAIERLALQNEIAGVASTRAQGAAEGAAAGAVMRFTLVPGTRNFIIGGLRMGLGASRFAGGIPFKAAVFVGNMIIFLKLNDLVIPHLQRWWTPIMSSDEIHQQNARLTNDINRFERNGWVRPSPTPFPEICRQLQGSVNGVPGAADQVNAQVCMPETPMPLDRVADLYNYKLKKWRQFLMREAFEKTGQWQDYVLQYTNTYTATTKVYQEFVTQIAHERYNVPLGDAQQDLYKQIPLFLADYQVNDEVGGNWPSRDICQLPPRIQGALKTARDLIDRELSRPGLHTYMAFTMPESLLPIPQIHPGEMTMYPLRLATIRKGLAALDCTLPFDPRPEIVGRTPTRAEIYQIRNRRWTNASHMLFTTLSQIPAEGDGRLAAQTNFANFTDGGRDIDHAFYPWIARLNIFMQLNIILGDVEPYHAGVGYLRYLNKQNSMVEQDHKHQHPKHVGRVGTPHMTEYLLAQAVCGPDVNNPSQGNPLDRARTMLGWQTDGLSQVANLQVYYSWRARFIPPRLITELGVNPCQVVPIGPWQVDIGAYPNRDMKLDPHMNIYPIGGNRYRGLLDILKANISDDVLGRGYNDGTFGRWWNRHIVPGARRVVTMFRGEFDQIIRHHFQPVIRDQGRVRDLPKGVAVAILEEATNEIDLINRIYRSGRNPQDPSIAAVRTKMTNFKNKLNEMLNFVKRDIPPVAFTTQPELAAYEALKTQAGQLLEEAKTAASASGARLSPAGTETTTKLRDQLFSNLTSLVTEVDSLHGTLVSLRAETIQ